MIGNLPGIAITKANLQGGTLHYSIDNGTNVGSVSENSARVLYADSDTRLALHLLPTFMAALVMFSHLRHGTVPMAIPMVKAACHMF